MIVEILIGTALVFIGLGILAPLQGVLRGPAWASLSLPIGAAVYLGGSVVMLAVSRSLVPGLILSIGVGLGVAGFAFAGLQKRLNWESLIWAVGALVAAALVVAAARTLHLTRLTPDSVRYLLFSFEVTQPEGLLQVHTSDLLLRQPGLPALHAVSVLGDRRYFSSIGPLFGLFGLGFLASFVWLQMATTRTVTRIGLLSGSVLFLLSSNRFLYDFFYINTHIEMAVYIFIAVAGVWLSSRTNDWRWLMPAGVALGATISLRPEAPLVVALVLVISAGLGLRGWPLVIWGAPAAAFIVAWYGLVLIPLGPTGAVTGITAPVTVSFLAVGLALGYLFVAQLPSLGILARNAHLLVLGGLAAILLALVFVDPGVLWDSITATIQNVTYDGLWLFTWPAAITLTLVAASVHRVPQVSIWTTTIGGFFLLFFILPLAREGAFRAGIGDSGNRMLAHILPVMVVFMVLAALDFDPVREDLPSAVSS